MNRYVVSFIVCVTLFAACSGRNGGDREPPAPQADTRVVFPPPTNAVPERPAIDLGDVDSGVFIVGRLAPESQRASISEEYVETMRNTLSMAVITVRPPFPERLLIRFELTASRAFEERPVVVRARALRDDDALLDKEQAYVMGKEANRVPVDASGIAHPRAFVVDALEGLDAVPETMLVHARADAWLMDGVTPEELLDPRMASSSERVALLSNPVRINFEHPEGTP